MLKVALIAPSATNDLAFTQSMYSALESLKTSEHLQISVSANEFVVSDAANIIREYASKGYNLVIAHGSQYGATIESASTSVPEGLLRMGNSGVDIRAPERLRLRGELERGWLRPGIHGRAIEQDPCSRGLSDRSRPVTPSCTSTVSLPAQQLLQQLVTSP